ncbi:MAG: hypothetical protein Q9213_007634, partial [Squamulea squamosa]
APESQPPPRRNLPEADIVIRHPGYREGEDEMMLFRGFDRVGERDGLHHGTVLTACHIVSGRNDGFLAQEKGGAPIELDFDDVLLEGIYYYTVPNDNCYAVFPCFEYWPFPHNNLPSSWTKLRQPRSSPLVPMPAQSSTAQAILDRDPTCLLSGLGDIRERAHICPKEESLWFQSNNMRRYNLNRLLTAEARIDDMSNATTMRSDIHKAYDKRLFVVVPKNECWTVHFMEPTFHLESLYHNMRVNLHRDLGLEHMFTRFAWTVFPLTRISTEMLSQRHSILEGGVSARKKRKTGGDDDQTVAEQSLEMEHRGRKRRRLSLASSDGKTQESKDSSGLYQSQSTCIPTTPSSTRRTSLSTSPPEPTPQVTAITNHHQSKKDSCTKTGITDDDPRIQQFYDDEDDYERLRRKELDRRRPHYDPDLHCCDYVRHREAVWAAIKGEGPWGVYELCDECLGGEYHPLAADLDG